VTDYVLFWMLANELAPGVLNEERGKQVTPDFTHLYLSSWLVLAGHLF